jgi:hypothetical protein
MRNMTQATTYWNKGRWDGFWEQGLFLVNLAKQYELRHLVFIKFLISNLQVILPHHQNVGDIRNM